MLFQEKKGNGINKSIFPGSATFRHYCAIPNFGESLLRKLLFGEKLLPTYKRIKVTSQNSNFVIFFIKIKLSKYYYSFHIFFHTLQLSFCPIIFAILCLSYSASKFSKALLKLKLCKPHRKTAQANHISCYKISNKSSALDLFPMGIKTKTVGILQQ